MEIWSLHQLIVLHLHRWAGVLGADRERRKSVEGGGDARRLWLRLLQQWGHQILCYLFWVSVSLQAVCFLQHKLNYYDTNCLMSQRTLTNCVAGCVWRDRSLICSLKGSLLHSWMLSLLSEWRTGKTNASSKTANACQGGWQLTRPAGTAGGQTAGAPTKWPQHCWMKIIWSSRSSNLRRWPLTPTVTTAHGERYTENSGVQLVQWPSVFDKAWMSPSHLWQLSGTSSNICLEPDVDPVQLRSFCSRTEIHDGKMSLN